VRALIAALVLAAAIRAQDQVSLQTQDGWTIHADRYGTGDRAVVLVHGGQFDKSSWKKLAGVLVKAGFRVLAIDLRADYGSPLDVLAAVRYLHANGARSVSVVGASMGGDAAAGALAEAKPGEIDRVVLLAHGAYGPPETLHGRKLFIVSRDDIGPGGKPRLDRIRAQFQKAPAPKELVVLPGSTHAQFIFETDQGDRLMHEILRFLSAP
jgi:hypothetical protein